MLPVRGLLRGGLHDRERVEAGEGRRPAHARARAVTSDLEGALVAAAPHEVAKLRAHEMARGGRRGKERTRAAANSAAANSAAANSAAAAAAAAMLPASAAVLPAAVLPEANRPEAQLVADAPRGEAELGHAWGT